MNPFAYLLTGDFLQALTRLLQRGLAWSPLGATRGAVLAAIGDCWEWFHQYCALLSEVESDPRQTELMLPDWEGCYGLPDPCLPQPQSLAQRRAALIARIAATGGQSIAYFIALAASFGVPITITEYRPFRCGISRCGQPLAAANERFVWQVNAPAVTITLFHTGGSVCGDRLGSFGNQMLECLITRYAPAQTIVIFAYG